MKKNKIFFSFNVINLLSIAPIASISCISQQEKAYPDSVLKLREKIISNENNVFEIENEIKNQIIDEEKTNNKIFVRSKIEKSPEYKNYKDKLTALKQAGEVKFNVTYKDFKNNKEGTLINNETKSYFEWKKMIDDLTLKVNKAQVLAEQYEYILNKIEIIRTICNSEMESNLTKFGLNLKTRTSNNFDVNKALKNKLMKNVWKNEKELEINKKTLKSLKNNFETALSEILERAIDKVNSAYITLENKFSNWKASNYLLKTHKENLNNNSDLKEFKNNLKFYYFVRDFRDISNSNIVTAMMILDNSEQTEIQNKAKLTKLIVKN